MLDILKKRIEELKSIAIDGEESGYRLIEALLILKLYETHLSQEKDKCAYLYDY
jgi:hypothetical protein